MWKLSLALLSCAAALILAFAILGESPGSVGKGVERVRSLARDESAPVLVLLVGDRSGVAAVRASVDANRILAETHDAIVLREGRVVATGPEVVGDPLMEAGFSHRSIELWAASQRGPRKQEKGEDGEPSLAALLAKPTLTPLEAIAILNGSVSGVEL